ncbi:MAG: hypothetical protein K1X85_13950 [Ignavibacteria bacterium]|nr:hypothetical protein [Ignavibacteria bacterium]
MKVTDDLFQLIKSLEQTEKRYFKVFSTMHVKGGESNVYSRLFDAIDRQSVYDEEEIKRQFKGEKFTSQIHVAKNYLYNNILKSLRLYHSENTKLNELMDILRDVQILYDKSLYKQCRKLLDKAKKIAVRYEKHAQILAVLDWEKTLARTSAYAETGEKQLLEYYRDYKKAIEEINNINEYWRLATEVFLLRKKKGEIRNKEDLKRFNQIIKHPLMQDESSALTFLSKTFYYNTKGLYYLTNKDFQNLYLYCGKLVKHIESNEYLFKEDNYVSALYNLLLVQIELRKFGEAFKTITKLRGIESGSVTMRARIFVTSYDTELNLYLRTGEFEKGLKLVDAIEEGLKTYKEKINKESEVLFDYNVAYLYFGKSDLDNSLKWINRIINNKELTIREDIQCFARILNIIVHYELGNYDLIEYIVKSTRRYLSSKNTLNKFELAVLSHIKKLINTKTDKEKSGIYEDWKHELESMSADFLEIKALEYFDFISWIDSKMQGKQLAEVVRHKWLSSGE